MVKSGKISLHCPKCAKSYVSEIWFLKHTSQCGVLGPKKSKIAKTKTLGKIDPKCIISTPCTADLLLLFI